MQHATVPRWVRKPATSLENSRCPAWKSMCPYLVSLTSRENFSGCDWRVCTGIGWSRCTASHGCRLSWVLIIQMKIMAKVQSQKRTNVLLQILLLIVPIYPSSLIFFIKSHSHRERFIYWGNFFNNALHLYDTESVSTVFMVNSKKVRTTVGVVDYLVQVRVEVVVYEL